MKQEDKELLLRDLCARLPHKVIVEFISYEGDTSPWFGELSCKDLDSFIHDVEYIEIKPYLRPMSSMTEEQFDELKEYSGLKYSASLLELVTWTDECTTLEFWLEETPAYIIIKVFDWLNRNHFDYRDLITRGLAIDCTNLNIY